MTFRKPLLLIAALGALGVAACDQDIAPAVPEPTPGPAAASNALNGTYNLLASDCGKTGSDKSLVIDGNKFIFPQSTCLAVSPERQGNKTRVTLSCEGSPAAGNRVIDLQTRPDGALRMTEDSITLTYFQCVRASASSDSLIGQTM